MFVLIVFQLVINRSRCFATNIKNRELLFLSEVLDDLQRKQESPRLLASDSLFLCIKFFEIYQILTIQRKAKTLYVNMLKSLFCLYTL